MRKADALVVLVTAPTGDVAETLAKALVSESLIACANLLPGVRSIYAWKGEICDDAEVLLVMKTTPARFQALRARVLELHPYDTPEVVAIDVAAADPAYLAWLIGAVAGAPSA